METIALTGDIPAAAPSVIRPRAADETILPAENWCPVYVFYNGTTSPKFNDSQIETLARQGTEQGWCNLCDAPLVGDRDAHVAAHMAQLRKWKRERSAAIERKRRENARSIPKGEAA